MAVRVDAGDGLLFRRLVPLLDEDVGAAGDVVGEVRRDQRLLRRAAAVLAVRQRHAGGHLRDAVAAVEGDQRGADGAEGIAAVALRDAALDLGDRLEQHGRHLAGLRPAVVARSDLDVRQAEVRVAGEQHVERRQVDRVEEELAVLEVLVRGRREREDAASVRFGAVSRTP